MRNTPVSRTEFDLVREEINELKRRMRLRENDHSPTVPVYAPDFPDDAIDGQVALFESTPWYFWDGVWRQFGQNTYTAHANYQGTKTIASNTSTDFDWTTKVSGTELFDRSTLSLPTILNTGIYAITIDVRCTSGEQPGEFAWVSLDPNAFSTGITDDPYASKIWPLARINGTSPGNLPETTFGSTYVLYQGATVELQLKHNHGSNLTFLFQAYVQRVA